jgi:hypothetical protein
LPDWVKKPAAKAGTIRHADKLRKNQPKEEVPAVVEEVAAEESAE